MSFYIPCTSYVLYFIKIVVVSDIKIFFLKLFVNILLPFNNKIFTKSFLFIVEHFLHKKETWNAVIIYLRG